MESSETQITLMLDSTALYSTAKQSPNLPRPNSPIPSSVPHCKIIPKTRFLVDAFKHAGDHSYAYFLSHFHADHYTGLTSNWSKGIIFCSDVTSWLVERVLGVSAAFIYPLPLRERVRVDESEVVLIDANHCPGAVQFLVKVNGERYVHTGDFRYCDGMKRESCLSEFVGCDGVFLDTTYCNPKFVFPMQEESVDYVVEVVNRVGGDNKGVLFLVATYVVGKEKILLEVARRCKRKVHVDARKMTVLRALGYGDSGVFTEDPSESDVHVVGWNVLGETWPYFRPNFLKVKEIMTERGYSKVVGFVPTGWTYEVKRNKFSVRSKDSLEIHLVPYSEHSNYDELREYVKFLKPKHVIPTVGLDVEKLDSKHANKMLKYFSGLIDEMAIKKEFLMGFHRGSVDNDENVGKDAFASLNEGLKQKELHKSSKTEDIDTSSTCILECTTSLQGPDCVDISDEEKESVIQQLRDTLPVWVTQEQILDLIGRSGRNIVEAVSYFYEHESEFYEQVSFCTTSVVAPIMDSTHESPVLSKPCVSEGNIDVLVSRADKSHTVNSLLNSGISSGNKRKGNAESKSNKKRKTNPKVESSGPKQAPITKFFSKTLPGVPKCGELGFQFECCHEKVILLSNDASRGYEEETNQFIQIINGNESHRSDVASILERTKGDINMALDLYYSRPEGKLGGAEEKRAVSGKALEVQQCCDTSTSIKESNLPDRISHDEDLLPKEAVGTYLSLPLQDYNPIEHACWKQGQPAPYLHLARTFDLVEREKGKNKATSMLCNMFRSLLALSSEDVLPAVYLCTNKIAADHENMELNIGGSLVTSALEEACGTKRSKIREMYNSLGDLGDVAQTCRHTQALIAPPSPLKIREVFFVLRRISVQAGSGSTSRKKVLIVNLMRSCREKEMKFLVRTLVRNLRIGAMMRTVLPALAQAVVMNSAPDFNYRGATEDLKDKLQCLSAAVIEAFNIVPNLDLVVPALMEKGTEFCSSSLSMAPGIPIKPMLAKITNGVTQALKLFENKAFTCEYKYDGQRAQIHQLVDGSIHVFSRNGDETTSRFPDLVNIVKEASKPAAVSFILDAEIVAVNRKNSCKLMSFQELSSRERGSKDSMVTMESIKVDICVFVFDVMFANGEQLLAFPLRKRRQYLKELFHEQTFGYFEYAREMTVEASDACLNNCATIAKINAFLKDAFHSSCEGVMIKLLDVDAGYIPSKRSDAWLKVKRDYMEGLSDSLDLVPIGAWHGNGRKAGWYSPFLMACYNPDTEEFQSVCRVMSGFSDIFYRKMKDYFSEDKILSRKPPYYRTAEVPDVWFTPELVWEIRGADFTISPVHQAAVGLVHPSRGISIRFPRFINSVLDRNPEDCSTSTDIVDMYHSQTRKMDVAAED